jgi:hypothetical protein
VCDNDNLLNVQFTRIIQSMFQGRCPKGCFRHVSQSIVKIVYVGNRASKGLVHLSSST